MKIKLSQNELKLTIILLSLIILGLTYQFVFVKNMDKTNDIQSEITGLNNQLMDKRAKFQDKENMEQENITMGRQINDIINSFGDGASEEKSIMFARELENASGMKINTVAFDVPEYFLSATNPEQVTTEQTTTDESGTDSDYADLTTLSGYKSTITISFQVSYDGLKKCLAYINQYPQRCSVSEMTVSFDSETGNLIGTMLIQMYHLQGGGRTYTEPVIGGVDIGTDNIFGTIELPTK